MITNIQQMLARDEGKSLVPYRDTKGLWSGGIGHCFETTDYNSIPSIFMPQMTEDQCDSLFTADLNHVWNLLNVYCPWWTTLDGRDNPRSNVLVNMGFNLGVPGLAGFHNFLNFMKAHDWNSASSDLQTTLVYKQLPERYSRLCQQIETGLWV